MKITEKELIQIINEEIRIVIENDDIDEGVLDQLKAKASGALSSAGSAIAGKIPGGAAASSEMAINAKLKQASSIMKSYAKHMQKLKLKLDADVTKLGIADIDNIKKVSQSIEQARATTQETAENAPRDEKFRRAVAAAVEQQAGGAQPAAASPAPTASPTPATAPATTPAAAASPEPAATTPAPTADAAPTPAATAEPAATEPAAAEPAAAEPAAAPAAAEPAAAEPAAAPAAETPKLDNRLQAWVAGGKEAGRITASQARTAMGTSRMTQKAGKYVFNSAPALEYAQQVAAALGDRAPSPLKKAIEDTAGAGTVNESTPLTAKAHQQLMNELGAWERQFESKGKETLEEQLQKISKRWGFGK